MSPESESAELAFPLRREWRLRDRRGDWIILRSWSVREGEEPLRDPPVLTSLLREWASDPAATQVLVDLCRELWGPADCRPGHPRLRRDLVTRLEEAIRSGRIAFIEPSVDEESPIQSE